MKKIKIAVIIALMALSASAWAKEDKMPTKNSPFGVLDFFAWDHPWNQHHYDSNKLQQGIKLMKEAGVGIIRMDFLWEDIEPSRGKFTFNKYDPIVNLLESNGIEMLAILHYNVSWNSKQWNEPPDQELFANYAEQVAKRYKGRIKYWEIWNEPNEKIYWLQQDDLKAYTKLLKLVYEKIKKIDPDCYVLNGGLSGECWIHLKRLYRNGGKNYFDIVNVHPFSDPLNPSPETALHGLYRSVYKVMEANGDEKKPIWFTELGCPGVPKDSGIKNWWFGRNPNEAEQARYLEIIYSKAIAWPNVERIFWAFFRDTKDHFKDGIDYFGMLRNDFSKKPSFEVYKRLAHTG